MLWHEASPVLMVLFVLFQSLQCINVFRGKELSFLKGGRLGTSQKTLIRVTK